MPKRVPLPSEWQSSPFLYRDARDNPLRPGRLRGADLDRPFRGVRVPPTNPNVKISDFIARCAAYAPLLSNGRFYSHLTAARLWGVPLPSPFTPEEPLHVSSVAPFPAPRMAGVVGHRSQAVNGLPGVRHGFPTCDVGSMWLALAQHLPPDELVVVGDYLVLDPVQLDPRDPRPFATIEELQLRLQTFHGRGSRALQRALSLIRAGAESRPETLLRLLLLRAGLPKPSLNVAVTAPNGRVLGRGDMVYERWHTVVEYDGDQHRTSTRQYDRDIHRLDSFRDARWKVVQVRSRGLFVNRAETVARVEAALRSGGWPG
jgi:hypothetical protein